MNQLSMFDLMEPPEKVVMPLGEERKVLTPAYGVEYEMTLRASDFEPFEIDVRGIKCLITRGFCTYTVDKPGSLFWSETGFRSFSVPTDDPDRIASLIESFIDGPAKDGNGCGGKLKPWWPVWVLQWCQNRERDLKWNREEVWAQWGPEKHRESWARHDRQQLEALERMKAEGIDPDTVIDSYRPKQPKVSMMEWQTGRAA